jgi:hypothetical protein
MMKKLEVAVQPALPPATRGHGWRGSGTDSVWNPPLERHSPRSAPGRGCAAGGGECWVGIDVAKAHLDVAIWPTRERLRVTPR